MEVEEKPKSEPTMKKLSAIVIGGTGAIGENVVKELLKSARFERVVTVGRREFKLTDESFKGYHFSQKLTFR